MAEAAVSDKFAQVRGFTVEIAGAGGKEHDTAWESCSGGALMIETTETTTGSDRFRTNSPGHKTVGEITLRGAMTDTRAALCQWINDTAAGRRRRRRVTITPALLDGTVGPAHVFEGCVITGYVFPRLDVGDQGRPEPLMEEVRFAYRRRRVVTPQP